MNWKTLFSFAASVLLLVAGFAIGNYLGQSNPPTMESIPDANKSLSQLARNSLRQRAQMKVDGVEIPIYDAPQWNEQLYVQEPQQLSKIEARLSRIGLGLDVQDDVLEGQLADGRTIVVPVRSLCLRSTSL